MRWEEPDHPLGVRPCTIRRRMPSPSGSRLRGWFALLDAYEFLPAGTICRSSIDSCWGPVYGWGWADMDLPIGTVVVRGLRLEAGPTMWLNRSPSPSRGCRNQGVAARRGPTP